MNNLRDKLLAAVAKRNEFEPIPVPTPAWPELDGQIFVQPASAAEHSAIRSQIGQHPDDPNHYARWVVRCACDSEGQPIFYKRETYEEDVRSMGRDITGTVEAIADKIFEVAALTPEARKELEKNFEKTRTGSSPTSSPGTSESGTSTECSPECPPQSSSDGKSSTG